MNIDLIYCVAFSSQTKSYVGIKFAVKIMRIGLVGHAHINAKIVHVLIPQTVVY